jgi:1-aminocyclopropane-1-carboxylate deaminase
MQLEFVSREDYRRKNEDEFLDELEQRFGRFFLVPEGGANGLGVRGCAEILSEVEEQFDIVCCAAGTATTLAGLAITLKENQKLIGFPTLKGGGFLKEEAERLIGESRLVSLSVVEGSNGFDCAQPSFELTTDYHFGGYAKLKPELLEFINGFTERTGIPLDPIYTSKMMFGMYDLILKGHFASGTTILAVHTGGLQGWQGMKHRGLV